MVNLSMNISYLGYLVSTIWPIDLVFMSTFDTQSMSIGCDGKLGHLLGFLRHYLLSDNTLMCGYKRCFNTPYVFSFPSAALLMLNVGPPEHVLMSNN